MNEVGGPGTAGARLVRPWHGAGKAEDGAAGALSTNASREDLATSVAYGAIAAMPAAQRARAEAAFQGRNLFGFRDAMVGWMRGTGMTSEMFADRFFGRSADDPVVQALRDAAKLAMTSTSSADMAAASGKVADAMQRVGLDRWARFVADAQTRASDPATEASIRVSITAPDAITPVYPLEYLSEVRGAAGLLRAGVGAVMRQMLPERPPDPPKPSQFTLPTNPDDLLAQGWRETTHPEAGQQGHRRFENPRTGETVRFDRGTPGKPAFEGQGHHHRLNPNKTGRRDEYLDVNGNPVARGSRASHILPGNS